LIALVLAPAALAVPAGYGPPVRVGVITSQALPEVSGLVAARTLPGAWWVLNDSGHPPELYTLDARGRLLATVVVVGATNVDWEDLAAGPNGSLYIADTGDNDRVRDDLALYRVPEPAPGVRAVARPTRLPFRYPDGRHDAEAVFADPATGRPYVVTKGGVCVVYRFPLPLRPGREVTLQRVRGRGARQIEALANVTGAAVSPDGTRVAIRTYLEAYELRRAAGEPFEALFDHRAERVRLPLERQGEAIAYSRDGRSLVTTSEQLPAPIWRLARTG
jgi:hypothetical protein